VVVSPAGMKIYLTQITSYTFDFCQKRVSDIAIAVVSRLRLAVGTLRNILVFIFARYDNLVSLHNMKLMQYHRNGTI
jgi:hypothetical protein